jgi:DNA-binding Lrp family transcriptional regulator
MTRLTEHQRDDRDLRILEMLDEGATQAQCAERFGMSRGAIARMVRDIRRDEAAS